MIPSNLQLLTRDWGQEWRELEELRGHVDDPAYWDQRSKTSAALNARESYVDEFLRLADIQPGESVLDMGCGTGNLAIPLGKAGHPVVAADFSRGMLNKVEGKLCEHGISAAKTLQMRWEDDWQDFGLYPESVDVAIASRSMATNDLRESMLRLTEVARRRVCVTMAAGSTPGIDVDVARAVGVEPVEGRDFQYLFNIAVGEGLLPRVDYIESTRRRGFASFEQAFEDLAGMVDAACRGTLTAEERAQAMARLREWLGDNLVENERAEHFDERGEVEPALRLRKPSTVTWAFISWNK